MMSNHIPLKITIYLENEFCHIGNTPFDGILARLYYEEALRNGSFDGNYKPTLPFLKRTDGVYHTSFPQYKVHSLTNITFFKAFDLKTFLRTGEKKKIAKSVLLGESGRYKSYILDFELLCTDKIEYFVNGDFEYISKLLADLKFIGKKASLGWGKVSRISIDEQEEDFSLVQNGIAMRNLPDTEQFSSLKNTAKVVFPLSPPYWEKSRDISLVNIGKKEVS